MGTTRETHPEFALSPKNELERALLFSLAKDRLTKNDLENLANAWRFEKLVLALKRKPHVSKQIQAVLTRVHETRNYTKAVAELQSLTKINYRHELREMKHTLKSEHLQKQKDRIATFLSKLQSNDFAVIRKLSDGQSERGHKFFKTIIHDLQQLTVQLHEINRLKKPESVYEALMALKSGIQMSVDQMTEFLRVQRESLTESKDTIAQTYRPEFIKQKKHEFSAQLGQITKKLNLANRIAASLQRITLPTVAMGSTNSNALDEALQKSLFQQPSADRSKRAENTYPEIEKDIATWQRRGLIDTKTLKQRLEQFGVFARPALTLAILGYIAHAVFPSEIAAQEAKTGTIGYTISDDQKNPDFDLLKQPNAKLSAHEAIDWSKPNLIAPPQLEKGIDYLERLLARHQQWLQKEKDAKGVGVWGISDMVKDLERKLKELKLELDYRKKATEVEKQKSVQKPVKPAQPEKPTTVSKADSLEKAFGTLNSEYDQNEVDEFNTKLKNYFTGPDSLNHQLFFLHASNVSKGDKRLSGFLEFLKANKYDYTKIQLNNESSVAFKSLIDAEQFVAKNALDFNEKNLNKLPEGEFQAFKINKTIVYAKKLAHGLWDVQLVDNGKTTLIQIDGTKELKAFEKRLKEQKHQTPTPETKPTTTKSDTLKTEPAPTPPDTSGQRIKKDVQPAPKSEMPDLRSAAEKAAQSVQRLSKAVTGLAEERINEIKKGTVASGPLITDGKKIWFSEHQDQSADIPEGTIEIESRPEVSIDGVAAFPALCRNTKGECAKIIFFKADTTIQSVNLPHTAVGEISITPAPNGGVIISYTSVDTHDHQVAHKALIKKGNITETNKTELIQNIKFSVTEEVTALERTDSIRVFLNGIMIGNEKYPYIFPKADEIEVSKSNGEMEYEIWFDGFEKGKIVWSISFGLTSRQWLSNH